MPRLPISRIMDLCSSSHVYVNSIFVPALCNFTALKSFSRLDDNISVTVNFPWNSQFMLAKSWYGAKKILFEDGNPIKFNLELKLPLVVEEPNPYLPWKGKLFTEDQLDYLHYWKGSARDMTDQEQRDIFWSAVYFVISYWLSNKKANLSPYWSPYKIMDHYLNAHNEFVESAGKRPVITNTPLSELEPKTTDLAVFPLLFDDAETDEDRVQTVFDAWLQKSSDLKHSQKELTSSLDNYLLSFSSHTDFSLFKKLAANSKSVAFAWSGSELCPRVYEEYLIEPLKRAFSGKYQNSKLMVKAVEKNTDSYDSILLFY